MAEAEALVIARDEAPSFWQPVPTNGHVSNILNQRVTGEAAPAPFARPDNIAEIEARTVFGWTDKSFDPRT